MDQRTPRGGQTGYLSLVSNLRVNKFSTVEEDGSCGLIVWRLFYVDMHNTMKY